MGKAEKFDSEKPMLDLIHPSLITTYYGNLDLSLEESVLLRLARIAHAREMEPAHAGGMGLFRSRIFDVLQEIRGGYVEGSITEHPFILCSQAMEHGIAKYGRNNWKQGCEYSRLVGAAMRHTLWIICGETHDNDSGLSHWAHVVANLNMLLGMIDLHAGINDLVLDNPNEAVY